MRLRLKEQDKEEYRPDSQTMVLLLLMTFVLGGIIGFVCLRSVLCFGVAALAFQYLLHPLPSDFAEKCDSRELRYIARIPFAIFVADIVVSLIVRSVNSIR